MKSHLLCLFLLFPLAANAADVKIMNLRCESLVDPQGIDVLQPRLSWILDAPDRGQRQSSYQVVVASDASLFKGERVDLWDSGKVASGENVNIPYAGKPLRSDEICHWRVRVWDKDGKVSAWSDPARWSMGILSPDDWKARWIGYVPPDTYQPDHPVSSLTFDNCRWIWFPEGDPLKEAPAGTRYFRTDFTLPAGAAVRKARTLMDADDRCTLFVNGKEAGRTSDDSEGWRTASHWDLAGRIVPGRNVLAVEAINATVSPAGIIGKLQVDLDGLAPVTIRTGGAWRCSDKLVPGWNQPDFDAAAWTTAKELGAMGIQPWGQISEGGGPPPWAQTNPSPIFRKDFTVRKALRSAVVSVCGLGYYELHLNGKKVGDQELAPVFTRYDKRCLYLSHDITNDLHRGLNALGVMLGNGFYNQHARDAWNFQNAGWRDRPKLLLQLHLVYVDGSTDTIVSDQTWKASSGPIVRDGIRNGEVYDARQERAGWDQPGFDDSNWAVPDLVKAPAGKLVAQMTPPIRVVQTMPPISVKEVKPGVFVFDMGQSFAGRAQLRVTGPAGTRVTMRYGELLSGDGTVNQGNINPFVHDGPFQTDEYILKGQGEEVYESRFTYDGFRWVEVRGFPGQPTIDSLRGRVLRTDFTPIGSFECSNDTINRIQHCTLWSYQSNFVGIPTDCPHREKNGWTGDAQLAAEQAMYNWDNDAAYASWMYSFDDVMKDSGELPGIVPTYDWGYAWGNGPAWDSAGELIPWYLYLYRADARPFTDHYARIKRYVDYCTSKARNGIVSFGLGDWAPAKTETPTEVTDMGYYYVDTLLLARFARLLGKTDDDAKYTALADSIRQTFNKTFDKGDGIYANGSQTSLSCALYQGLVPPEERQKVVDQLAASVRKTGYHIDTGILGAKYLFHALSDNGKQDMAWQVAVQPTYPSYAWWLKQGATTLWESWDGGSSRNHIMYGDISGWYYQAIAGILPDPEKPGFRHIFIKPMPAGDLTWVKAHTDSVRGRIVSEWEKKGGKLNLHIVIPPGCSATVWVPSADPASVKETEAIIKSIRTENGAALFEIQSGSYSFEGQL